MKPTQKFEFLTDRKIKYFLRNTKYFRYRKMKHEMSKGKKDKPWTGDDGGEGEAIISSLSNFFTKVNGVKIPKIKIDRLVNEKI